MKTKILRVLTEVIAAVAAVIFIVGNWFPATWIPAAWLTPMAWTSSMMFCVAAVLGAVWFAQKNEPPAFTFPAVLLLSGGVLSVAGMLLALMGNAGLNPEFVKDGIFTHPTVGVLACGVLLLGLSAFVYSILLIKGTSELLKGVYGIFCSLLLGSCGFVFGGVFWIIPFGAVASAICGYIFICSLCMMLLLFVAAIISGRLNRL